MCYWIIFDWFGEGWYWTVMVCIVWYFPYILSARRPGKYKTLATAESETLMEFAGGWVTGSLGTSSSTSKGPMDDKRLEWYCEEGV